MCVLRATGAELDAAAFLRGSPLQAIKVFRRGEPRLPRSHSEGPRYETSGITIEVSLAPRSNLEAQIADAEAFLRAHCSELQRLAAAPGLEDLTLDFPTCLRIDGERVAAQFDRFPA